MKRVSHSTWAAILGVVHLGLMVNLLVLVAAAPLILLLFTTDPVHSWPLLAAAAPLAAPALSAAFATFREHAAGETQVVRAFWRGWRTTWRRAMLLGLGGTALVVVLLVDVRVLSGTAASVAVVPVLGILTLLALAVVLIGLVALAEAPGARLRDVVRAAVYLGNRRWYLTALSFAVLAVQAALFTTMPAIAIGLTAAPALYVAWANSRHTLRPVLEIDEVRA
ncbi:DUF624 domain-containing protein [Microbacterium sp. CIAB417]|uniref:DUF624 domain-containing protein n=1 Tax=Microbacterium sp. CIAB417 TaxID=2860287 RepID=UPI001FAC2EC0|nr:DUF624 domain-containing protein [Microbacterium sp. CIAB417]